MSWSTARVYLWDEDVGWNFLDWTGQDQCSGNSYFGWFSNRKRWKMLLQAVFLILLDLGRKCCKSKNSERSSQAGADNSSMRLNKPFVTDPGKQCWPQLAPFFSQRSVQRMQPAHSRKSQPWSLTYPHLAPEPSLDCPQSVTQEQQDHHLWYTGSGTCSAFFYFFKLITFWLCPAGITKYVWFVSVWLV